MHDCEMKGREDINNKAKKKIGQSAVCSISYTGIGGHHYHTTILSTSTIMVLESVMIYPKLASMIIQVNITTFVYSKSFQLSLLQNLIISIHHWADTGASFPFSCARFSQSFRIFFVKERLMKLLNVTYLNKKPLCETGQESGN